MKRYFAALIQKLEQFELIGRDQNVAHVHKIASRCNLMVVAVLSKFTVPGHDNDRLAEIGRFQDLADAGVADHQAALPLQRLEFINGLEIKVFHVPWQAARLRSDLCYHPYVGIALGPHVNGVDESRKYQLRTDRQQNHMILPQ